jgi:hypothetical protein
VAAWAVNYTNCNTIRRAIHEDRNLSTYAPNIKTSPKTAKLRPEDRCVLRMKKNIQVKAVEVAGEENVTD